MKTNLIMGIIALLLGTAAQAGEVGYEEGSLGFEQMVAGDWLAAEQKLNASADELGADPARLLQLAEVYRVTGREGDADALYRQVLSSEDMTLVLADGRIVSAHNIASMRLSTEMQAAR
ncbi:MAG: hypothetical protein V2J26_12170 [Pacificimonas sp.]|jgi:hypothetical protein|nr:hypothetical protein [Pacificimonas sp.]